MKVIFILIVLVTTISSCKSVSQKYTLDEGFIPLLHESDFKGWYVKIKNGDEELANKVFTITEGVVHVFGDSFAEQIHLNEGTDETIGMMYTEKQYENFHIKFEYKWGTKIANYFDKWQYDAGVYFYVIDDKIFPTGIEYQIHYDHIKNENHTGDAIRPKKVAYDWYGDPELLTYLHPNEGGILTKKGRDKPWLHNATSTQYYHSLDGQWNSVEIIAMSAKYVIYILNGQVVNMLFNPIPKKGIISFQAETAEIFYRNIQIKEYTDPLPAEVFLPAK